LVIFRGFRQLVESIQSVALALEGLAQIQRELGPALDRLDNLERSRHHFEAECSGLLLKAEGQWKAAKSSEQRERQLKRVNERSADPFDHEGEAESEAGTGVAVPPDAGTSPPEGVSPVRLVLATNDKAHAVRTKWGIG